DQINDVLPEEMEETNHISIAPDANTTIHQLNLKLQNATLREDELKLEEELNQIRQDNIKLQNYFIKFREDIPRSAITKFVCGSKRPQAVVF
ncbi:unnamed protein product, partial [Rotaria magnacalcarata]